MPHAAVATAFRLGSGCARLVAAVCLAAVVETPSAEAQTASSATGAIAGSVRDTTGTALREAVVTLTSPALMSPRSTRTSAHGTFTFSALPPGTYAVAFEVSGFAPVVREGIALGSAFMASVDVVMAVDRIHEGATVVAAPLLDRRSTSLGVAMTAGHLASLPGSRSMGSVLAATPGVSVSRHDVGGSSPDTGQYAANGTAGFNRPMVEGICIAGIMSTGMGLDLGSFDEVSVGTGAHSPEWNSAGVQMQFLSKSGSNQYRGTASVEYGPRTWQASNIDDDQIRRGAVRGEDPRAANQLWQYRDTSADVGGYIVPDALWWYAAIRDHDIQARQVNFPVRPQQKRNTNYTGKVTAGLARAHTLIAYGQAGRTLNPFHLTPFALAANAAVHDAEDATAHQHGWGWIGKVEWNAVLGRHTYMELRAGQFGANLADLPNGSGPRFEDISTLQVRGAARHADTRFRRSQVLGTVSRLHEGRRGEHHLKAGGEIFLTTEIGGVRRGYGDDVVHVLSNGLPREVYLLESPSSSESGLWTYGAFVQDSWKPLRRLTVNLGLRFDRYRIFLPEQAHPSGRFNPTEQQFPAVSEVAAWNELVPRVGATYDIAGDGRTILKASFSRFSLPPGTFIGFNANPNAPAWWTQHEWLTDANGNGRWDRGEEGRLLARRGGVSIESLDAALALPTVSEAAAWTERELPAGVALRTGIVRRSTNDYYLRTDSTRPFSAFSLPVLFADPGPDGSMGTADDGAPVPGWEIPLAPAPLPARNIVANVPGARSRHWTWDVVAQRRHAGRWSLLAGFSHTWNGDQGNVFAGQAVRQNAYPVTPNDLIQTGRDGRYDFRTWTGKLHAVVDGPWGLRIAPLLRHQSGQPFGRTFVARTRVGNIRVLAEPMDTRRTDHVTLLDVRIAREFRLGGRRLSGFVDVFNTLNSNAEPNVNWTSGPSFLQPVVIVPPRIARLGARLEW